MKYPGLAEDLQAAIDATNTRRCTVCVALDLLPESDGEWLRKALASKLGAKKLSVILQNNAIAVGVPSIHQHRSEGHTP